MVGVTMVALGSGPYLFTPVCPRRKPTSTKYQMFANGSRLSKTNQPLWPLSWHRFTFTANHMYVAAVETIKITIAALVFSGSELAKPSDCDKYKRETNRA